MKNKHKGGKIQVYFCWKSTYTPTTKSTNKYFLPPPCSLNGIYGNSAEDGEHLNFCDGHSAHIGSMYSTCFGQHVQSLSFHRQMEKFPKFLLLEVHCLMSTFKSNDFQTFFHCGILAKLVLIYCRATFKNVFINVPHIWTIPHCWLLGWCLLEHGWKLFDSFPV